MQPTTRLAQALRRSVRAFRFWLAVAGSFVFAALPVSAAESLTIAAGAGYKRPVAELAVAFERRSGIRIEPFFGHMGQVLAQARQSDRIAVVLGDQAFLENAGQPAFARYLPAGRGRLVLAWPTGRTLAKAEELAGPSFARIALPDERQAVYGKAASQFLERSGLEKKLEGRLIMVANVPQVSAYLVSGEVDAGFVNLTDALGVRERIGGFLEIDPALYDEVRIVAGVVAGREKLPGVEALADFLATPEAEAILARHGL
ncbi:molybdate ABC transporter, periplasmic molybdate-binding protein [Azotobacter vinelandii CA]|uniref:Molybdate ABC transporter, periplasmic molybdate-binding protein n=1 Tax=Azotobacter vinelandii (strain DJ / ATCC BAA-1303) TaxID=322710 RepID=C1DM84_AZOVD|nr:molybdate ABC transporter substrate-binding protein [Azotobacter vinelandii]ACO81161.1 molybdate ABC transporter, periplasmic molybdate-binding protein [Azotobacter vinelandii DJ]AGK13723.1 molybdate ABC transporter, periplasmic molybdate-binding protein [Azotobacter vinelandii CA]WKN21907.1 molybdate ABC transporter substrate-binding protein [Azotobacter vinelandii]SFX65869.1 molybdate transport system substrate-binding protein [Azotobacter vinelandii]